MQATYNGNEWKANQASKQHFSYLKRLRVFVTLRRGSERPAGSADTTPVGSSSQIALLGSVYAISLFILSRIYLLHGMAFWKLWTRQIAHYLIFSELSVEINSLVFS